MDGQVPVIVATVSFGMGVDKGNVRWAKRAGGLGRKMFYMCV